MAFAAVAKNLAVDAVATAARWISMHTGDPSTTGANEATYGGGGGRQQTTWPGASAGTTTGSEVTHSNLPAAAYTHWGAWTLATAGVFHHGNVLTPSMTLGGVGTLKVTPQLSFP